MELIKNIFLPITAPIKFIQEHFKAVVFVVILIALYMPQSDQDLASNNLQEINLFGPIMDATEVVAQIDEAAQNSNIKGVLLVVDSPGGAVAPSIEIAYAVKRLREAKPVAVYAKGTIASGSYYASIWADEIMANPGSMVGSIGVIMEGANVSGLMQKLGIESQSIQAGKFKKVGTPSRKWSEDEVAELNKVIQGTYDMFTKDVADARKLDINKRDIFANAHIFTAFQAKNVGLIDTLGVNYDAKKRLEEICNLKNPIWNKEDKFDKIMKKLTASTAVTLHTYFPALVLK